MAVRYLLHNTVTSVNELEHNTKASVLGVIPTYDKEKLNVSRLVVDKNPKVVGIRGYPLHSDQPGLY